MALINHRAREIHFKIVYVGPGAGGKTTNLRALHDRLPPERRGRLLSISTDHERTLFFDFLPIDLGQVNGFSTRFHLYTVPGQVYYRLSRRAVLQGLDGIVFVADSHPSRESANLDALADTYEHMKTLGMTPGQLVRIPWIFQFNKRDLPGALPIERLRASLNREHAPEFEATATLGAGVTETLRAACKAVLARLGPPSLQPQTATVGAAPGTAIGAMATASAPSAPSVPRPASAAMSAAASVRSVSVAPSPAATPSRSAAASPPAPAPPRPVPVWPGMPPAQVRPSSPSAPRPVITQVPGSPARLVPPPPPGKSDG